MKERHSELAHENRFLVQGNKGHKRKQGGGRERHSELAHENKFRLQGIVFLKERHSELAHENKFRFQGLFFVFSIQV